MIKKICFLFLLFLLLNPSITKSQNNNNNNNPFINRQLINLINNTGEAYLLSANRPYVEMETTQPGKGKAEFNSYPSGGGGYVDIPFYVNYGIGKRISVLGSIDLFTTGYSFVGNKFNGIGDSYAGILYQFQKSKILENFVQGVIKIPTASVSNHIGTGKVDYHLGLCQSFTTNKFLYTLTGDFELLGKLNFPSPNSGVYPPVVTKALDSLEKQYDYSFEQQLDLDFEPSYYITSSLNLEAGATFSRNMKLNFNATGFYSDLNYYFTDKVYGYSGADFTQYFPVKYNYSDFYAGAGYDPNDNLELELNLSISLKNSSSYYLSTTITYSY